MTDAEELFEELQSELQETGETLGELLQQAVERLAGLLEFRLQFLEEFFCVRHRIGGTNHGRIGMVIRSLPASADAERAP